MALPSSAVRFALFAIGALACAHCGGVAAEGVSDGGVLPDGAPGPAPQPQPQPQPQPGPACPGARGAPTNHRAVATACTSLSPAETDAGLADACTVDTDCPTGNTCECSGQIGGNARSGNQCLPTTCRVDSDCGAGGFCSPSSGGRCSGLTGYFCHGPSDCCTNDSDCATGNACLYDPTVSHWQCAAVTVCNG
jgi:hypothetical protein